MSLRTFRAVITILLLLAASSGQAFVLPNLPEIPSSVGPAGISINHYPSTLWAGMRQHFQLQDEAYTPEVQAQIRWLQAHKIQLNQQLENAAPYLYYVYQQTVARGLPAELALLPFIESQYDPYACSSAGAVGLWQMMPGTASGFGVKINWWYDGRRDVISSTRAALDYLTYLHDFFDGDWRLAIAAYDSGEGTVLDAVQYNRRRGAPTDFWNLSLPAETRSYIPKLLALSAVIKNPSLYDITLPPLRNRPYFSAIDVGSQITLGEAAKLADIPIETLRKLNPGFRRDATDPDGPYILLIPVSKAATFEKNLAELPQWQRIIWRHYLTQDGDTLEAIAARYRTSTTALRQVNQLTSNQIHAGENLLIPESFHGKLPTLSSSQISNKITEDHLPGPKRKTYIVRAGDSLEAIAQKFRINLSELRFWNGLSPSHILEPGDDLILWLRDTAHHSSPAVATNATTSYQVQSGDTLTKIAQKFQTSVSELKVSNQLNNSMIQNGQILKVPVAPTQPATSTKIQTASSSNLQDVTYTVRPGDSISKIAKRFKVQPIDIIQWNNLPADGLIHPQDRLTIKISPTT